MRLLMVLSVVVSMVLGGEVSAVDSKLETLFPDGGLRYKSCRIAWRADDAGYEIVVRRDCPSGDCYPYYLKGEVIKVNSQEMQSGGKTLKNYHRINSTTTASTLLVREFNEWTRERIDLSGGFGGGSKTIGYIKRTLKMRIANDTGAIEEFAAYMQAYRKPSAFGTTRNLLISHRKRPWVECESPAPRIRYTLLDILQEQAPIEGWPLQAVRLSASERADLATKLLHLLPSPDADDYTQMDGYTRTPLHYAAYHGLEDFARQLIWILAGLDQEMINWEDSYGETPLYHAVDQGQIGMVKLLLSTQGIDVGRNGREGTPKALAMLQVEQQCTSNSEACTIAKEIAQLFD